MSTVKRIVCLANSQKKPGRCVAGKEIVEGVPGGWVRPVSTKRPNGALSPSERVYISREEPAVLDILECRVEASRAEGYQTENWGLAGDNQFKKIGTLSWADLGEFVDYPRELWLNGDGNSSEFGGKARNRIPVNRANALGSSLLLIKVDAMHVEVSPGQFGRSKMRGHFQYGPSSVFTRPQSPTPTEAFNELRQVSYELSITDPVFEQKYTGYGEQFSIGESYLTISLGVVYDGYVYKLIAGIMEKP